MSDIQDVKNQILAREQRKQEKIQLVVEGVGMIAERGVPGLEVVVQYCPEKILDTLTALADIIDAQQEQIRSLTEIQFEFYDFLDDLSKEIK